MNNCKYVFILYLVWKVFHVAVVSVDTISSTREGTIVDGVNLDEMREFAKQFKIRRLSLGLTQTQVGQALSVTEGPSYSQSAICRYGRLKRVLYVWIMSSCIWSFSCQIHGERRKFALTIVFMPQYFVSWMLQLTLWLVVSCSSLTCLFVI